MGDCSSPDLYSSPTPDLMRTPWVEVGVQHMGGQGAGARAVDLKAYSLISLLFSSIPVFPCFSPTHNSLFQEIDLHCLSVFVSGLHWFGLHSLLTMVSASDNRL